MPRAEATLGGGYPVAAAPAVRADDDRLRVGLVDVEAACLAEPPRARLSEAWRGHEDGRSRLAPTASNSCRSLTVA